MKYITQKTIDLIQATARKDNKVTFLLGNGVNSQFEEQGVLSWGDLMEDIAKTMGSDYESIKDKYSQIRNSQLQINQSIVAISFNISKYIQLPNLYEKTHQKQQNIVQLYTNLNDPKNEELRFITFP